MKTRAELKMDAKQQLRGNYGLAIGVLLTMVAISLLVLIPFNRWNSGVLSRTLAVPGRHYGIPEICTLRKAEL